MTAIRLEDSCWTAYPSQPDRLHWDTEALALTRIAVKYPAGSVIAAILPEPCWVMECDPCGLELTSSKDSNHGAAAAESEQAAREAKWIVTIGGLAYCPGCRKYCHPEDIRVLALIAGLITDETTELRYTA